MRVPGPEVHFLLNPLGLMYTEITASNLLKVDLKGRKVNPSQYPVHTAGFVVHMFVKPLNGITIAGFPLGFYLAAQGSLIVYVVIIGVYARYMNALDRRYNVHEGEDA